MAKILVVDDSMLTRAIMAKTLTDAGFEVVQASDGFKGVEVFAKENPDLVLTDFMMPGMDGIEMAQKLKQKKRDIPIILQSVEFDKNIKLRSKKVGINDYLFKNFEKKELIKKVKALL